MKLKLFDAHCHLQDPRLLSKAPQLISTALESGVVRFAVNGTSEKDWNSVKQMSESYPSVIPCFGIHPWFVAERTPNWFDTLKQFFETTPSAAVGELEVFEQQLELAKLLKRPASVHCVRAFGDLLQTMQRIGPFPAGIILHSYLGSAEMVPAFAELGAYFSFSGFLMSMKESKAKKMLKKVPSERILLETDAPDALPRSKYTQLDCLYLVEGDPAVPKEFQAPGSLSASNGEDHHSCPLNVARNSSSLPKETLNHPANILNVLNYVAMLLEMSKEEVAEMSYQNAVRLFSYQEVSG